MHDVEFENYRSRVSFLFIYRSESICMNALISEIACRFRYIYWERLGYIILHHQSNRGGHKNDDVMYDTEEIASEHDKNWTVTKENKLNAQLNENPCRAVLFNIKYKLRSII